MSKIANLIKGDLVKVEVYPLGRYDSPRIFSVMSNKHSRIALDNGNLYDYDGKLINEDRAYDSRLIPLTYKELMKIAKASYFKKIESLIKKEDLLFHLNQEQLTSLKKKVVNGEIKTYDLGLYEDKE